MLTEAYNAKRAAVETLKDQIRKLEAQNAELRKELEQWEAEHAAVSMAQRKAAYYEERWRD